MSRFSAEYLQLALDSTGWQLRQGDGITRVAAGKDPAAALATLAVPSVTRRLLRPRLEVDIADHWLRYLVIDWPAGLRGRAERATWVSDRFFAVHGIETSAWATALDRDAAGSTTLACAAPRELVDAVVSFARAGRMRIDAFGGHFAQTYNQLLPRLGAGAGALALCRDGRLTLGLWRGGRWQRVRSLTVGTTPGLTLSQTLAAWLPGLGADADEGLIHTVGIEPAFLPAGWRTVTLGAGT